MTSNIIFQNSSNLLTLSALTNESSDLPVNNATVVWTLYDLSGNQISTGTLTSTDNNGDYEGVVSGSGLTVGQHYNLIVNVNSGAKTFDMDVVCLVDDGDDDESC